MWLLEVVDVVVVEGGVGRDDDVCGGEGCGVVGGGGGGEAEGDDVVVKMMLCRSQKRR